MAFVSAFSQLRISGQMVSATPDNRLVVNGVRALTVADSGAFISAAVVAQTGQQLGASINSLSGWAASATNLTATGVQLGASITALSGWAVATLLPKGAEQSYVTGLASGSDTYAITFPTGFAGRPRVGVQIEVSSPVVYGYNISQVTSAGFTLYLSDTVSETGLYAHIEARL